jgi:hypothetical protein
MSYRVVLRDPSWRGSDSIVIANAGHVASQSLHAIHRSSPLAYLLKANRPLNRGDIGVCSSGNCTVIFFAKKYLPVKRNPLRISINKKLCR